MMPADVAVRLLASFAGGFIIVALVTTLADRFGEGPAGFLGGLPSTGAVSFLAIGATESNQAAVQATTLFPLGFSVSMAFLLFYTYPSGLKFWRRMSVALVLWAVTAVVSAVTAPDDFPLAVAASLTIALLVIFVRSRVAVEKTELPAARPGFTDVILRGTLGGSVVTAVVVMSMLGGPLEAGVFAAAPAIWSSSLYVTSRSRGVEFSRSLTWTFMQTGILVTIPFGILARYFFTASGVWLGTLLTYAAVSPLAYLAWKMANRRTRS